MFNVTVACPLEVCEDEFKVEFDTYGDDVDFILPAACPRCKHTFTAAELVDVKERAQQAL